VPSSDTSNATEAATRTPLTRGRPGRLARWPPAPAVARGPC